MLNRITVFLILSLCYLQTFAQSTVQAKFTPEAWEVSAEAHEFNTYKGKEALLLKDGVARLKGSQFKNGIIDYDINFEEGRKFLSFHFRITENKNYEEFYLRPHQSGNPDATQYTPVFNGSAGWQLYHGEGYANPYNFNFGEWIHVRLIVAGDRMDVFINDMSKPFIHVHDLKQEEKSGRVGFSTFRGPAWYANLSYQELDQPRLLSEIKELPEMGNNILKGWEISSPFSEKELEGISSLDQLAPYTEANWIQLDQEYTGLVNISSAHEATKEKNTVLVRTRIYSDRKQLKKLELAYSDRLLAFSKGKALYAGQRNFRSRDYRYLGTIGFFDSIFVELEAGENEIVFALSESMGGWGINARLLDTIGIRPN
ncbi:MAG: family 16 glycoside hydrolase [Bacteroidota bacterium]